MIKNEHKIYQNFIKENLFDFFWEGNDYIFNKFHQTIGSQPNVLETLQEHFNYEIFNCEKNKLHDEGYLISEDSILFYCSLIDRVFDKYKLISNLKL
jgi:hypothetical protein